MISIELNARQRRILEIVKQNGPITGDRIAEILGLTRATLRPDLAILTMSGFLEARPRVGYFYAGDRTKSVWQNRLKQMTVQMFKAPPIVVEEHKSVQEAIVTLFLEDVGTLYIIGKDRLLSGVVSRKDLLRAVLGNKNLEDIPVGIIMTRMPNIVTVRPEETLFEAAQKLLEYQVDSLPVVVPRDTGRFHFEVVGRFTKTTVTRAFIALGKEDLFDDGL